MSKISKKVLIQFAEYMVAGGAWFWSGYFIIVLTTPHIGLWWANLLGNSVGLSLNFLLQREWVFKNSKNRRMTEVSAKYVAFTAFNFLLNYIILRILIHFGIRVAIGQFIAAAFFTVWNYFFYRFWIFKETPSQGRIRHYV